MDDESDAKRAIAALNGKEVCGKSMVVELSTGLNKRGLARKGRSVKTEGEPTQQGLMLLCHCGVLTLSVLTHLCMRLP